MSKIQNLRPKYDRGKLEAFVNDQSSKNLKIKRTSQEANRLEKK